MITEHTITTTRTGDTRHYFVIESDTSDNVYYTSIIIGECEEISCSCRWGCIEIGTKGYMEKPCKHVKEAREYISKDKIVNPST